MSTLDLLDDSFPHGTPNGYRRGCRTAACPALIPCRTVHTRYVGDFSFARLFDAGTPLTETLERDAAARESWQTVLQTAPNSPAGLTAAEYLAQLRDQ